MSSPVIRVENLSKLYRLGEVGTGSLAHDVNRWWHRIRGHEDPYSQIGRVNDRTRAARRRSENGKQKTDNPDYVWALKDINFEVKQGEVLGIIGRNGAGKSTLLKILSRVTAPTSGQVKVKGRIASLLEVGTGFHPELTGRENTYLNGVKRYSSGMQVRLAFAVAAHLEPEIMVVDEVLAVGDAEFQNKCLGKLRAVAGTEGRTVLFVSHNMQAIAQLCDRVIMVTQGSISADDTPEPVIATYLGESSASSPEWSAAGPEDSSSPVTILRVRVCDENNRTAALIPYDSPVCFEAIYREKNALSPWVLAFGLSDHRGEFLFYSWDVDGLAKGRTEGIATWKSVCRIPGRLLNPGRYYFTFSACELGAGHLTARYEHHDRAVAFEISPQGFLVESRGGVIAPELKWSRAPDGEVRTPA